MGDKDILEKILMSYADVFADCVNVFLYHGRRHLREEDLQPAPTESFYQGKGWKCSQFTDRSFFHRRKGEIRAQYFIENETRIRKRQVIRKVSYQGGAYREQLDAKGRVYPVIGIALDWTRKRSRIPLTLHRLLALDGAREEELQFVDDAGLSVFHMKNLSEEIRSRFRSDMGFVVDYLNEGSLERRRNQKIVHAQALCEMMEALTGDTRFTEQAGALLEKQEKGEVAMCEYIDMLEERGEKRGIAIGMARGEEIGMEKGQKLGEKKGENRLAELIRNLLQEKKFSEIEQASSSMERRQELYRLYGI